MTPDQRRELLDNMAWEALRALAAGTAGGLTLLFLLWFGAMMGWTLQ